MGAAVGVGVAAAAIYGLWILFSDSEKDKKEDESPLIDFIVFIRII